MRAAHWLLAASVITCLVLHHGGPWHENLGYAALAIALWRIAHGLVTRDRYARFAAFVLGPRATLHYARQVLLDEEPHHLGHNPLGGWMVAVLLAVVLAAGGTGALYVTDAFWGVPWVIAAHAVCGWALAALVPLHLVGVIFISLRQGENLVRAMLTGRKAPP